MVSGSETGRAQYPSTITYGQNLEITLQPNRYYAVEYIKVNNVEIDTTKNYKFYHFIDFNTKFVYNINIKNKEDIW